MRQNFLYKYIVIIIGFLCVFTVGNLFAQEDSLIVSSDTVITDISDTVVKKKHNPKLATLMSVVVPGSGQVYNKKYWKVPIIYAGFGAMIALYAENQKMFKQYDDAHAVFDTTSNPNLTVLVDGQFLNKETIEYDRNQYRNARDLNVIIMVGIYLLNVIDASVDAHLFDYDVSDDLSIRIQPIFRKEHMVHNTVGVKLNMYF